MNSNRHVQEESGAYIWLRYATQYNRDGHTHTVEMSIPVPIGATPEVREQLIREAEEGMQQFATHMQQREPFIAQRTPSSQNNTSRTAPQPLARTKPAPTPQVVTTRTGAPSNRPASQPAPHTSTQSVNAVEQATGMSEKRVPGASSDASAPEGAIERPRANGVSSSFPPIEDGELTLPVFLQYIREHMNLTAKQAMDMLNVKSLNRGINLRDALEQLKGMNEQGGPSTSSGESPSQPASEPERNHAGPINDQARRAQSPSGPLGRDEQFSAPIEMRTRRPVGGFDEEIDLEDLDGDEPFDGPAALDELEDLEDFSGDQFSARELEQAREKLDALRAIQGATTVSDNRLKVLNTVVLGQITNEQLNTLIQGVWNISVPKKLKVDQVEELISWAKREDAFIEQVEAILAVLG